MLPENISLTLFYAGFGEWVESNIFSIIQMLMLIIGGIITFVRLQARMELLMDRLKEISEEIETIQCDAKRQREKTDNHIADSDRHVNHLHMKAIESRMDKIEARFERVENSITQGFNNLNAMLSTLLKRDH